MTSSGELFSGAFGGAPERIAQFTTKAESVLWDSALERGLVRSHAVWHLNLLENPVQPREYGVKDVWALAGALSGDGNRVAFGSAYGHFEVHDVATSAVVHRTRFGALPVSVGLDARGDQYAVILNDRSVLFGRPGGPPTELRPRTAGPGVEVAESLLSRFAPDGQSLLVSQSEPFLTRYSLRRKTPALPVCKHEAEILDVAFLGNQTVATASADQTARLWTPEGRPLTPPLRHHGPVTRVAFSRSGAMLATCSRDGSARIWDTATGDAISPPLRHKGPVRSIFWSGQDASLITGGDDGALKIWTLDQSAASR